MKGRLFFWGSGILYFRNAVERACTFCDYSGIQIRTGSDFGRAIELANRQMERVVGVTCFFDRRMYCVSPLALFAPHFRFLQIFIASDLSRKSLFNLVDRMIDVVGRSVMTSF